ncbi:MAG: response regulator [Anaerolineae bacterium]|jgi:two-component system KDP operon response regulator KdpE
MKERPKVLIVDDDQDVRTLLELALSHAGFQVFSAPNGSSALLQLRVVQPDLVILDVLMPDPDGWRTLQRIREFSTVPVLILTAVNEAGVGQKSLAQGADGYLRKPVDVQELQRQAQVLIQGDPEFVAR